jgi:hypothetical protein
VNNMFIRLTSIVFFRKAPFSCLCHFDKDIIEPSIEKRFSTKFYLWVAFICLWSMHQLIGFAKFQKYFLVLCKFVQISNRVVSCFYWKLLNDFLSFLVW